MKWVVYFRNKDGKKVSSIFEAETRKNLFEVLAESKITPVSINEYDGKKLNKTGDGSGRLFSKLKFCLVGGVAIIVIGISLTCLNDIEILGKKSKNESRAKAKKQIPVVNQNPKSSKNDKGQVSVKETKRTAKTSLVTTNNYGQKVIIDKDGTRSVVSSAWAKRLEERKKNPPKRVFKNLTEGYMALFLRPGEDVPPPPHNITDQEVQDMLISKIVIDEENDTDDEIRQKKGVISMKDELRDWIKNGGTFASYLQELRSRQSLEADQMNEARKMITESLEKGDMEEAKLLYKKINEHLRSKYLPDVRVAPKYRKFLEERDN